MSETREELRSRITSITTPQWTPEFRDRLDDKNLRALAGLSDYAQELVIRLFTQTPEVRNEQSHAAAFIRGFTRALEKGVSYEEGARITRVATAGKKVSYNPCKDFKTPRGCKKADCQHLHVGWTLTRINYDDDDKDNIFL